MNEAYETKLARLRKRMFEQDEQLCREAWEWNAIAREATAKLVALLKETP